MFLGNEVLSMSINVFDSTIKVLMCRGSHIVNVHLLYPYFLLHFMLCALFPLVDMCMYTASVVHIPYYCLYRIAFIFIPTAIYYH